MLKIKKNEHIVKNNQEININYIQSINYTNLVSLTLSGCGLETHLFNIILEKINNTKILEILDCSYNKIDDYGIAELSKFLCYNTSLEYINIISNSITKESHQYLLEALDYNQTLMELKIDRYLSTNKATTEISRNGDLKMVYYISSDVGCYKTYNKIMSKIAFNKINYFTKIVQEKYNIYLCYDIQMIILRYILK